MTRRPAPLPASLPGPVFSTRELDAAGVGPARARRGDLVRLRRGLLAVRGAEIEEADLAAALCRSDPQLIIVGASAARLLDIPLPAALGTWSPGTPVDVSFLGGARRGRSDGVVTFHRSHRAAARYMTLRIRRAGSAAPEVIRVCAPAWVWAQLAPHLGHADLVVAGDHLVRIPRPGLEGRAEPWTTIDALAEVCTGPHAVRLRAAAADVRVGADSPQETRLRLALVAAGLPEPLLNVPILGADGRALHSPDIQWPTWKVCGEYDGGTHAQRDQVVRDIDRALAARAAGFEELRFARRDAERGWARAVDRSKAALIARGWVL